MKTKPNVAVFSFVSFLLSQHHLIFFYFQSNEWIRVRIQQMEPDLMEVGASLDEARALRREHDELLVKLNVSTPTSTKPTQYSLMAIYFAQSLPPERKDITVEIILK